jgi:hypothetical protein
MMLTSPKSNIMSNSIDTSKSGTTYRLGSLLEGERRQLINIATGNVEWRVKETLGPVMLGDLVEVSRQLWAMPDHYELIVTDAHGKTHKYEC